MEKYGAILMLIAAAELFLFARKGFLLRGILCSAGTGLGSLLLIRELSGVLGFTLPMTASAAAVSAVLGMPGTTLLLLGRVLLQMA